MQKLEAERGDYDRQVRDLTQQQQEILLERQGEYCWKGRVIWNTKVTLLEIESVLRLVVARSPFLSHGWMDFSGVTV